MKRPVYKSSKSLLHMQQHGALIVFFVMLVNGRWRLPYTELSFDEQSDVEECVECMVGKVTGDELLDLLVRSSNWQTAGAFVC
jgi:hypothetical protein